MKEKNPEKYAKYLEDQKIRAKARREALKRKGPDDPQVLREKKLAKKRQLKYRLKAKEQNPKDLPRTKQLGIDLKKERKTRQDEQAMRQYWAEAKRRSRENLLKHTDVLRKEKETGNVLLRKLKLQRQSHQPLVQNNQLSQNKRQ